jgi:O-antigen/teichoic acid export membrane protein
VIDKVIRAIYTLFVGVLIARYFGPEKFGLISITVSLATILASFANFGADGIVVKELSIRPSLDFKIFGTIFLSRIFACVSLYLILVIYYIFFANYSNEEVLISLLISSTLLFNFSDAFDLWFQYKLINHKTILTKIIILVLIMIVRYLMLINNTSLLIFSISYFIESLFSLVSMYILYFLNNQKSKFEFVFKIIKIILHQSWPNLVSGLMVVIYMRIDQVMINILLSKKELGIFSAAIPFSTAIYFLPMTFSVVLSPVLSKIRKESKVKYNNILKSVYSLIWIILIPYCIIFFLLSPYLVNMFYGVKFVGTELVLRVLVFTSIPVSLGVIQGIWMINEKLNIINLYKSIIGAISNIFLNYLLIPKFGIMGAAYSTLASYFLSAMFSNFFFCREVFYAQLPRVNKGIFKEILKL